jgi:hypothetical protein
LLILFFKYKKNLEAQNEKSNGKLEKGVNDDAEVKLIKNHQAPSSSSSSKRSDSNEDALNTTNAHVNGDGGGGAFYEDDLLIQQLFLFELEQIEDNDQANQENEYSS